MDEHKTLGAFLNAVLQDRKLTGQALAQGANTTVFHSRLYHR